MYIPNLFLLIFIGFSAVSVITLLIISEKTATTDRSNPNNDKV